MRIELTRRDGTLLELDVEPEGSLMEAIRLPGEIAALCGGACICGTCHVRVDPVSASLLEAPSEDEVDLLSFSPHRSAQSRLACQITLVPALDGLKVAVAPE